MFAELFKAYVNEEYNWEDLCELADPNRKMFIKDYEVLRMHIQIMDKNCMIRCFIKLTV